MNINAQIISKIPEASGICYLPTSKNLIVVNDEGYIYKLDMNGNILSKKYLGDYDLEGITYHNDTLLLAVEDKHAIFILDAQNLKILRKIKIKKNKDIEISKKHGLEGIAVVNNKVYVSHQTSGLFKIKSLKKKKAKAVQVAKYKNVSGLSFHKEHLYILNDNKNSLIKYDLKTNKKIKQMKLPKSAQEGICFDDKNNMYIADDNGFIHKLKAFK